MKVLVCGGRNYADYHTVFEVLGGQHRAHPISCIIQGGALGADRFAMRWAHTYDVFVETFNADWKLLGSAAGPVRNARMLREGKPELVIAFPGGTGTANMVRQARDAGVRVQEIVE